MNTYREYLQQQAQRPQLLANLYLPLAEYVPQ